MRRGILRHGIGDVYLRGGDLDSRVGVTRDNIGELRRAIGGHQKKSGGMRGGESTCNGESGS